jgi:hypothetical protein
MDAPSVFCHSAREVIGLFGGPTNFARWWKGDGIVKLDAQRASAWGKRNSFPRQLFPPMSKRLLAERSIEASPSAWGLQDFHHQQAAE